MQRFDADKVSASSLQQAKQLTGNVPLFVIKLVGQGQVISFQPLLEQVVDVVQEALINIFSFTDDIVGVGKQLLPLLQLQDCNLRSMDMAEEEVVSAKQKIDRILLNNMAGPKALKALYDEFDYMFQYDVPSYCEHFAAKNPSLEQYDEEVRTAGVGAGGWHAAGHERQRVWGGGAGHWVVETLCLPALPLFHVRTRGRGCCFFLWSKLYLYCAAVGRTSCATEGPVVFRMAAAFVFRRLAAVYLLVSSPWSSSCLILCDRKVPIVF